MSDTDVLPFWKTKSLYEMTRSEWESLCDGCGLCCLNRVVDDCTETLYPTKVACSLLDTKTGRCSNYKRRRKLVSDCMKLTPKTLKEFLPWLPETCSYKRLYHQKPLPEWHPLITGNFSSVKASGHSILCLEVISEHDIPAPQDWYDYIIRV